MARSSYEYVEMAPMTRVICSVLAVTIFGCTQPQMDHPGSTGVVDSQPRRAPSTTPVKGHCSLWIDHDVRSPTMDRKGASLELELLVALEGTETVIEPAQNASKDHAGDRSPMRVLLTVSCDAFIPDGEPSKYDPHDTGDGRKCTAITLLMNDLDAGKGFSMLTQPRVGSYWRIRSMSSTFSAIALGRDEDAEVRVTGIREFRRDKRSGTYDTRRAHISWEYAVGTVGAGTGASRVALAADCPSTF